MTVEVHNEAGRCRQKGCRSAKLLARNLCQKHYGQHRRQNTLHHFPTERAYAAGKPHACQHEPSANCYSNHGCRCPECRKHINVSVARNRAQRLTGKARIVPASVVLPHLAEQLARPGVTKKQCAETTGLPYQYVKDLTNGRKKKITPDIASTLAEWHGNSWCEKCGPGVRAYSTGRYCTGCYNYQRRQHAA